MLGEVGTSKERVAPQIFDNVSDRISKQVDIRIYCVKGELRPYFRTIFHPMSSAKYGRDECDSKRRRNAFGKIREAETAAVGPRSSRFIRRKKSQQKRCHCRSKWFGVAVRQRQQNPLFIRNPNPHMKNAFEQQKRIFNVRKRLNSKNPPKAAVYASHLAPILSSRLSLLAEVGQR